MYAPYPVKLESVLNVFSDEEQVDLFKAISNDGNNSGEILTPLFLMNKLGISRRGLNERIEKLLTLGLVDMINGVYSPTLLGKEIYCVLIKIEDTIKIRYILNRNEGTTILDDPTNEFIDRVKPTYPS